MDATTDFDRQWLERLATSTERHAGPAVCRRVLRGSDRLDADSPRDEVIDWTRAALQRLAHHTSDRQRHDIMTGCACEYPRHRLAAIRAAYRRTGDVAVAHRMLEEQFVDFLRETLELDAATVRLILGRGWGLAGVLRDDGTLLATKIPASGQLRAYLETRDPERRRLLYCHCPRVRDAVRLGRTLPVTYCLCGAGFYRGIWQEILGRPVRVEVVSSVLAGDEACRILVHLPPA
ncbi:MAG: hypothetical protein PVF43_07590 [Candidatus Eiseniibacteriota bacterium]|jgi:predicted hydrocarbon binding protein